MALVPAYDARTGRKQRQYVPESWFDHPVLGKTVRRTPRSAAAKKASAPAGAAPTKAPAAGAKKASAPAEAAPIKAPAAGDKKES